MILEKIKGIQAIELSYGWTCFLWRRIHRETIDAKTSMNKQEHGQSV
jgi:hypothetical protein